MFWYFYYFEKNKLPKITHQINDRGNNILVMGTNAQVRELEKAITKIVNDCPTLMSNILPEIVWRNIKIKDINYCSQEQDMLYALTNSNTPENKSTWKRPLMVLYTGLLRTYDYYALGSNATDNLEDAIKEKIEQLGIQYSAKIDLPYTKKNL